MFILLPPYSTIFTGMVPFLVVFGIHGFYWILSYLNLLTYTFTRHQVNTKIVMNNLKYMIGTIIYMALLVYGYTCISKFIVILLTTFYTAKYYYLITMQYDSEYFYVYDINYIYILLTTLCHLYGSGDYLVDFISFIAVFSFSIINID
jgi:hypothetical protein